MELFEYLANTSVSLAEKMEHIEQKYGSMPAWYQQALQRHAEEGSLKPNQALSEPIKDLERIQSTFTQEIENLEAGGALGLQRMEAADLLDRATRIVELARTDYHRLTSAEEAQALSRLPLIRAQLARVLPDMTSAHLGPQGISAPSYAPVIQYIEQLRAQEDREALYLIAQIAEDPTVQALASEPLGVQELDPLEQEIRKLGARYRYLAALDQETRKAYAVGQQAAAQSDRVSAAVEEQVARLRSSGYYGL